jgi:hypothetical protein
MTEGMFSHFLGGSVAGHANGTHPPVPEEEFSELSHGGDDEYIRTWMETYQ